MKALKEQEAQDLMIQMQALREAVEKDNNIKNLNKLKEHEIVCFEKFKYIVYMKTNRYKQYANYEDLNQEGYEVLIRAMKNYNPKKGNAFWWFHKYIGTKISRTANLHTVIRYPLKVSRKKTPHREMNMPVMIEGRFCPDKQLENSQIDYIIHNVIDKLTQEQKDIINCMFGINGEKPMSISKITKKLGISRLNCVKSINSALSLMRKNIHL